MTPINLPPPVLIYNLFPRLVGAMSKWTPHIARAHDLGFTWLYINPISYAGFSGSLYSVKDYYKVNPLFLDGSAQSEEAQVRAMVKEAHGYGLKVMFDLVINHTAIDSVLVEQHPDWYLRKSDGAIKNPQVWEGDKLVCTWGDLAEIDNRHSSDRDNLWLYWDELIAWMQALGVDGFRCDAAYQVPIDLWHYLLPRAKQRDTHTTFFAETLGCEIADIVALAGVGFDYTFNSSKWWDFKEPWCLEQYAKSAPYVPSVAFAESHDTPRLAHELHGNIAAIKLRYIFSALFSSAVMMPIGFEYGFQKRVNVVKTMPEDWEEPTIDLRDFVRNVNTTKKQCRVFNEEGPLTLIPMDHEKILVLLKTTFDGVQRALMVFNLDKRWHHAIKLKLESLVAASLTDISIISPEHAVDGAPGPFDYQLRPGQVMVWVTGT